MKASEIMSTDVHCVAPGAKLEAAARTMREFDVGALPVCENDRLVGVITDRDIVIRTIAEGRNPADVPVRAVMSADVVHAQADEDVRTIAQIMETHRVRRLPLLDRRKKLVGIISTADLALEASSLITAEVMKDISTPAGLSLHA